MRVLYFFLLIILFSQSLSAQFCHPQDSLELVKLYHAADGPNWPKNWDLSKPVRYNWPGVGMNDDGRVTGINLRGNKLLGTLPNLNLPEVKWIDMSFNQLTGSLPVFDSMPILEVLLLFANQFSDSIPSFNNLSKIREIDLSENQLSSTIPDFVLPTLQKLNLSYNEFTGGIPACDCPNLVNFLLEKNELTGEIPNFTHPKLGWLNLSLNHFTGNIPDFDLPELTILAAFSNELSGNLPDFSKLPKLRNMVLHDNQFTGNIPNFQLPHLSWIYLNKNKLEGSIPAFDLPEVTALHLGYNQLTGNIPDFQLPKIASLGVSNNFLSGKVPDFDAPNLHWLYLDNNHFTFDGAEEIKLKYPAVTVYFNPQAPIPLLVSGNVLSVNAGGTPENNTYFWYKDSLLVAEKTGDSTFLADQPGSYFCQVSNNILVFQSSGIKATLVSEKYSHTVSTEEGFGKSAFQVSPNPIVVGQPLLILLENNFLGTIKIEILNLDGRVLQTFFTEKTSHGLTWSHPVTNAPASFLVRVSDGHATAVRLVLKF